MTNLPSNDALFCMPCAIHRPYRRMPPHNNERQKTGGQWPVRAGPSGCWLMTVKTWTGIVLIQFHGSNVENTAAVWALYRRARGMRNLQWFKWHKGTGPEIQHSSPGIQISPTLHCLSPPLSISLLYFTFSSKFAHLLSLILWWSFCLFPCLQSLSFIFPLQPNCLGSSTPPAPHPSVLSPCPSTLYLLSTGTPRSLWGCYETQSGEWRCSPLLFFLIKILLYVCRLWWGGWSIPAT